MDKKGFTVVELIVTFVFVMIIAIGLMNLVNGYRDSEQKESTRREINTFKNEILMAVQNDAFAYVIDSIDLLEFQNMNDSDCNKDPDCLPSGYDRGLKICFKIAYGSLGATPANCKKLLVNSKGGSATNTTSKITYMEMCNSTKCPQKVFEAPSQFIKFESDTMLETYTENGHTLYKATIKMLDEDINEYFNLRFAAFK